MPWKPGQSGNPNGRPLKDRAFSDALRAALDPLDLAAKLAALVADGNLEAIKYAYNRIEGIGTRFTSATSVAWALGSRRPWL